MHPHELTLNLSQAARAAGRPANYYVRYGHKVGAELGRVPIRELERNNIHVPDDLRRAARPFADFLPRDQRLAPQARRGRPRGPALPGTKLLSIVQACEELNISRAQLYRLADRGALSIVRLAPRCVGVPRTHVDRLVSEGAAP